MVLAELIATFALMTLPAGFDDAPSVQRFKTWLSALNAGDREALRRFHAENASKEGLERRSSEQCADMDTMVCDNTGGLELETIEKATDTEVIATARSKLTGSWVRITMEFEKDVATRSQRPRPAPDLAAQGCAEGEADR